MAKNKLNGLVDKYLVEGCGRCKLGGTPQCKVNNWQAELKELRKIALKTELVEDLKWGSPCYTLNGKNVIMIVAFKESCVLSFFKGSLMNNGANVLDPPGENSQAHRMWRFTHIDQIKSQSRLIDEYIKVAIELEKSGAKIDFKARAELEIPVELTERFKKDKALKKAFEALTPGRQRSHILHITAAKQEATRINRVDKCAEKILAGKGFNEY